MKDEEAYVAYPKKVTPIIKDGEIVGVEIIEEIKPIRSAQRKSSPIVKRKEKVVAR